MMMPREPDEFVFVLRETSERVARVGLGNSGTLRPEEAEAPLIKRTLRRSRRRRSCWTLVNDRLIAPVRDEPDDLGFYRSAPFVVPGAGAFQVVVASDVAEMG